MVTGVPVLRQGDRFLSQGGPHTVNKLDDFRLSQPQQRTLVILCISLFIHLKQYSQLSISLCRSSS